MKPFDLITILGPTASGKTKLAARLAARLDGEVISADSRQVYRQMDIGTGKDLNDYKVDGLSVPFHLIDIVDPGEMYDVFRFTCDFIETFREIKGRGKQPLMCGGSGMYLEAVISAYHFVKNEEDPGLRQYLEDLDDRELKDRLQGYRSLHNITDLQDRKRTIRALEIAIQAAQKPPLSHDPYLASLHHLVIGIELPRNQIRERITRRLHERLETGLVEEVKGLIRKGISPGKLRYYGLEYRFITDYLTGLTSYDEMVSRLNTAIHQFAKRQMTWFRRMEKKGIKIHWISGLHPIDQQVDIIIRLIMDRDT